MAKFLWNCIEIDRPRFSLVKSDFSSQISASLKKMLRPRDQRDSRVSPRYTRIMTYDPIGMISKLWGNEWDT